MVHKLLKAYSVDACPSPSSGLPPPQLPNTCRYPPSLNPTAPPPHLEHDAEVGECALRVGGDGVKAEGGGGTRAHPEGMCKPAER